MAKQDFEGVANVDFTVAFDFTETWDTTSEWDAGTHTRTSARASVLEPGFRDDHDDGTIDSGWIDNGLDTGGEDEGVTVSGAYWFDFNAVKTTRVVYEDMDIQGYDVTAVARLEHTAIGTGEGDEQITFCFADDVAASAAVQGAHGFSGDRSTRNVWISSGGTEGNADENTFVKTAGDPFWLKLVYDDSANSYTSYYATSDPFSGGTWNTIGSQSNTYDPRFLAYAGDDGDGAVYYSYMRPSNGIYQTEWRDPGDAGGSSSPEDLEITASIPSSYTVGYTLKTSDDGSTAKSSTSGSVSDGTNSYDVSSVSDGQYVAVAFDFTGQQLDLEDAPTIDSVTVTGVA